MLGFEQEPAVGHVMALRGQGYEFLGLVDHVTMAGAQIKLWAWRTSCEACEATFEVRSSPKGEYLSRRCENCRTARPPSARIEVQRLRGIVAQEIADAGRRKSAEAALAIIEAALVEALPAAKREQKRQARREMRKSRKSGNCENGE